MKKRGEQFFKSNSGISLVEGLVTVLIFSFLTAGLYSSMAVSDNSWHINKVQIELQQELRKAMEQMKNDLRQAGDSSIVDVPADGQDYTSITFKTPSGVSGGAITWNSDSIVYAIGGADSDQILRTYGSNSRVLSQFIKSMVFTRSASTSNILEVALVGEKVNSRGETIDYNLDFQIQLRN